MDIRKHLLIENSKQNWEEVCQYVGNNPERFNDLMQLFMHGEMRLVQRASQPVGKLGELYPALVPPFLPQLIRYLQTEPIPAVRRNTMRILQFIEIPEEIEGTVFDIGLNYLASEKEPIAVKAFSMTVLRRICEKYPELAPEVIHQIEILVNEEASAGILSRGRHELKNLRKLNPET